ncbi:prepilin-type N-terminal cleavage/methylation domain-containing protein [Chloroflexota bacterium]
MGLRFFKGQKGFSLLEVLIALSIFSFIGVAIFSGFFTSSRTVGIIEEKTTARVLITEYMEAIRQMPYSADYSSVGDNITRPFQYDVVVEVEGSDDDENWQVATGNETLQRIFVSVFREDRFVLKICTFRTPREE